MGGVVKFISGLFGGGNEAEEAAKKQEELARIARDNQRSALQAEEKTLGGKRPPRGRRLLIAEESGEGGLKSKLG